MSRDHWVKDPAAWVGLGGLAVLVCVCAAMVVPQMRTRPDGTAVVSRLPRCVGISHVVRRDTVYYEVACPTGAPITFDTVRSK
jgi:hypothetical protein